MSVVVATISGAQTRFEWPHQQMDVGTYTLWDQCLGAAIRVRDSVEGVASLTDTLTLEQYGPFRALEPAVAKTAGRCAASIPLSSVTLNNTLLVQQVLLSADRDTDILPLYRKRFDLASTDSLKIDVTVSTVRLLAKAIPARLQLADSLLSDIQIYDTQWVTVDKLDVFGILCRLAYISRNDTLVTKYCGGFLGIVDKLTDGEFSLMGPALPITTNIIYRIVKRIELQDSLRKSSLAYVRLALALQAKAFRGMGGRSVLGEKAVPIRGDFWFPESARSMGYPRSGKITVVLNMKMGADVQGHDLSALVMIRRLATRFPDLDIVTLSGTTGHFGVLAPPPPAVEAELNYQRVINFYKIPMVAAVTTTPYWRLSDPDHRRVFDPYPHSEEYLNIYRTLLADAEYTPSTRLSGWGNASYSGLLVDAEGVIVDFARMSTEEEATLVANIEILMKRTTP